MNRRTFLRDSGALALGLSNRGRTMPAIETAREHARAVDIVVFDPSLAAGRRLARMAAHAPVLSLAVDAEADIGALWHARIAPRIARHATLALALRAADAFVLARFAAAFDCEVIDAIDLIDVIKATHH